MTEGGLKAEDDELFVGIQIHDVSELRFGEKDALFIQGAVDKTNAENEKATGVDLDVEVRRDCGDFDFVGCEEIFVLCAGRFDDVHGGEFEGKYRRERVSRKGF